MADIKMVCVMRTDLRNTDGQRIPKGKYVAQAGHAYVALATQYPAKDPKGELHKQWFDNSFVKIALQTNSLEDLLNIYMSALDAGLNVTLVTDKGDTQFGGVPTITCIGLGPDYSIEIDKFTGHLKSL